MRAMLLSILLASAAYAAPIPHYNVNTGNVTITNIGAGVDTFNIHYPARYNLIEDFYDPILLYRPKRLHTAERSQPDAYLSTYIKFQSVFGFPETINLGEIMVVGATGWEDDFYDAYGDGESNTDSRTRWWNHAEVVINNAWHYEKFVIVPEPSSLWILSGLACFLGGWFLCGGRE